MYRELKPMLTPSELIEHLETKGVKFELINRENAKKYLEENNNYFKLVSYRKNFPKYQNGEKLVVNDGNTFIQIQPKGQTLTIE